MKVLLLLSLFLGLSLAFRVARIINNGAEDSEFVNLSSKLFKRYCNANQKHYTNSQEYNYRYNIFVENLRKLTQSGSGKDLKHSIRVEEGADNINIFIVVKKQGDDDFQMNLNSFADLSDEEFRKNYLLPPEFFDEKKYKPVSKLVEEEEGKTVEVELDDDIDPIDEVLKINENRGFTVHDSSDPFSIITNFHVKLTLRNKVIKDVQKVFLKMQEKSKENESESDEEQDFSFLFSKDRTTQANPLNMLLGSNERRLQFRGMEKPRKYKRKRFRRYKELGGVRVPTKLNWNRISRLTGVKNQRDCNSCYVFSANAALEAHNSIINNQYRTVSEQEILDCSYRNKGCTGGQPFLVYDYIIRKGISYERDYPYTGKPSRCRLNRRRRRKFTGLKGYIFAKSGVVNLIKALQYGPVAIVMYASDHLKYYYNGIYDGQGCKGYEKPNHSALVYGYNLDSRKPYFILKNGWGSFWGDRGHYKMSIGPLTNRNKGHCYLAQTRYNVLPILK